MKRAAERQITSETCEAEEERKEKAGCFQKASEDELKGRVFKQARRTRPIGEQTATERSGIFAGIRFGTNFQNGPSNQKLSFPTSSTSSATSLYLLPSSTTPTLSSLSSLPSSTAPTLSSTSFAATSSVPPPKSSFLSELKNLNTSVNGWITKHVRENPYVDLSPIFRDYERHLKALDKQFQVEEGGEGVGEEEEGEGTILPMHEETTTANEKERGSAPEAEEEEEGEEGEEGKGGKGGEVEDREETESDQTKQSSATVASDDRDTLFSVRSKLFFKKGDEFTELGVGMLRVLRTTSGVRVILRNDTAISKVLLNVFVTKSVPLSSKANNVFLVCAPNPPLASKEEDSTRPVTYLLRVKTATLAAELVKTLKEGMSDQ